MANEYVVSQVAAEVINSGAGQPRVSAFAVEVLRSVDVVSYPRVSAFAVETLHTGVATLRVSALAVEVLRTTEIAVPSSRRRQIINTVGQ